MAKSKKSSPLSTSQSNSIFATGRFNALAIEATQSESDEEIDLVDKTAFKAAKKKSQSSASSKKSKSKQRAKDRERKLESNKNLDEFSIISTPSLLSSSTNLQPDHLPLSNHSDSQLGQCQLIETQSSVEKIKSLPSIVNQSHSFTQNQIDSKESAQDLTAKPHLQLKPLAQPDGFLPDRESSPPNSTTSASTTNSVSPSPSTTDIEDEIDDVEAIDSQSAKNSILPQITTQLQQPLSSKSIKPSTLSLGQTTNPDAIVFSKTLPSSATPRQTGFVSSKLNKKESCSSLNLHSPSSVAQAPSQGSQFGADHTPGKKWQSVLTRVLWGFVMVGAFIALMTLGHVYLIVLVFIIQLSVFREVSNLSELGYRASAREHAKRQVPSLTPAAKERKRVKDVDKNRWSKVMSWYFFCVANYFLYGESIIYYFKHVVFIDAYLLPFARHHRFISMVLYLIGFLAFVAHLDRGHLRRQFGLFSWIHMCLLLVVASGQFMVNNILEGLIWFWVPASLVIMNDIAAYVFGMLFGKHQLIKLSPKKTVEGFIGGYFATVIFAVLWGSLYMGWNYMICPVRDLGMTAFSDVQCVPNNAFVWRSFSLPDTLVNILSIIWNAPPSQIWWTSFQLHCVVLGTFAGLVAPFGGFFASGFKRAFGIKDFGDTIPGHGGLTDRFDCQFLMGLFTYYYYTSIVREQHMTIGNILEIISTALDSNQQLELYEDLKKSLIIQGILT